MLTSCFDFAQFALRNPRICFPGAFSYFIMSKGWRYIHKEARNTFYEHWDDDYLRSRRFVRCAQRRLSVDQSACSDHMEDISLHKIWLYPVSIRRHAIITQLPCKKSKPHRNLISLMACSSYMSTPLYFLIFLFCCWAANIRNIRPEKQRPFLR